MNADLPDHHLRRIVRALTPPAGQPPRMHLHTTGVGEATVRVNTNNSRLSAVVHVRQQRVRSTSDGAVTSPIGGM